jgi:hypothetical protein
MREDVFTTAAALQVLVSASGGDHRATFGHTSRDGSHERWPVRGYALCAQPWPPTVLAPTGILPPLLALTRRKHAGPQVWMRALQLAGSIARSDDAVVHEMSRTGWPEVCASVVTANPDPDFTEAQSREFVVEREVWQWLDERFQRSGSGTLPEDSDRPNLRSFEVTERFVGATASIAASSIDAEGDGIGSVGLETSATDWYGKLVRVTRKEEDGGDALGFAAAVVDGRDVAVFLTDDGERGERVVSASARCVALVHDRLRAVEASTSD